MFYVFIVGMVIKFILYLSWGWDQINANFSICHSSPGSNRMHLLTQRRFVWKSMAWRPNHILMPPRHRNIAQKKRSVKSTRSPDCQKDNQWIAIAKDYEGVHGQPDHRHPLSKVWLFGRLVWVSRQWRNFRFNEVFLVFLLLIRACTSLWSSCGTHSRPWWTTRTQSGTNQEVQTFGWCAHAHG